MADATPPRPEFLAQFFKFDHLPPDKQAVSRKFGELAVDLIATLPSNPERTVALRKLLEAKDCAVRAAFAVMSVMLLVVIALGSVPALAQTVTPAAPGILETLKANFLTPAGVGGGLATVLAILGGFQFFTEKRKRIVGLAIYHAFHVVEDIGAEIEGDDAFDKTAKFLKVIDDLMVANGYRPLKPGEVAVAKIGAQALHGAEVAKEKIAVAAAEAHVEAVAEATAAVPKSA